LRDRVRKVEGQAGTTISRVGHGSVYLYVHIILCGDALCIIYLRGLMRKGELLQGPPILAEDVRYPQYILTVVFVGYSLLGSMLWENIFMSRFTELKFTMLCLGTTISDGGSSKRSDVKQ